MTKEVTEEKRQLAMALKDQAEKLIEKIDIYLKDLTSFNSAMITGQVHTVKAVEQYRTAKELEML